jgi:DNA modification methylase
MKIFHHLVMTNTIIQGDALTVLRTLPDDSVDCCVTSPPYYGLRDYGVSGQIGLEETPEAYKARLVSVFMEVYRVLKPEGTLWLNIGDTYNGSSNGRTLNKDANWIKKTINKNSLNGKCSRTIKVSQIKDKDLIGIPWMLAFVLRDAGWYLRQDIIWHKPCPMPESVTDRCTKSHEYIFLLSKSRRYYFNNEAIMEPAAFDGRKDTFYKGGEKDMNCTAHERWVVKNGVYMRNKRSVWTVNTEPYHGAHFATYPQKLIVPCIMAGCPEGGIVIDPFAGTGTTAVVARKLNRNFIIIELNPESIKLAETRLREELGMWL